MKLSTVSIALLLAVLGLSCGGQPRGEVADLDQPYLGQEPPGLTPELFAPGVVSTDNLEAAGVFTPDMREFYFTRQVIGTPPQTLVIRQEDGAWQQPTAEPLLEGLFFSPDGATMHFGNEYKKRTAAGWSETKRLGPMFDGFPIMRLTTSAAGTYVFDEREEIGTLRYSRLVDGRREEPKPFGDEINTGRWTAHPFIASDESFLIWDSEREGGHGGTDLYISFRQDDGSWGPAVNMGEDVNTEHDDSGGSLTPDGKYFFFDRLDIDRDNVSESEADIYWVDAQMIENLRPE